MNIRKHIPNSITSMNLLSGIIGVIFCFHGRLDIAFLLMLLASVFDFCDGLAARVLGAYSPVGKELDSLADVVSFGVLPSIMLFLLSYNSNGLCVWCVFPALIAIHSALRLAKFNLDERQHESFIGLATPSCAMICGSLAYYVSVNPDGVLAAWCAGPVLIPVMSVVLACLLVSEIPMFSMKLKKGESLKSKTNVIRLIFLAFLVLSVALCLILHINWSMAVLVSFIAYVVLNVVCDLFWK